MEKDNKVIIMYPDINEYTADCDNMIYARWNEFEKKDKSEKFLCILNYYSVNMNNIPSIDEWEVYDRDDPDNNDASFCICSQPITNKYYIRNKFNNNILRVGSECVKKIDNKDIREQIECKIHAQTYKNDKRNCEDKRMCRSCGIYKIDISTNHQQCEICRKTNMPINNNYVHILNKKCQKCYKKTIPKEIKYNNVIICEECMPKCLTCKKNIPKDGKTLCEECMNKEIKYNNVIICEECMPKCLTCKKNIPKDGKTLCEKCMITENIFCKHPYIGYTVNEPNNGFLVTNISELETIKSGYNHLMNKYNITNVDFLFTSGEQSTEITQNDSILDIINKLQLGSYMSVFKDTYSDLEDINNFLKEQEKVFGKFIPYRKDIFRPFELCPLDKVKVVLLYDNPYSTLSRGKYIANGLACSVNRGMELTPILKNIYKLLSASIKDIGDLDHGDLSKWAKQGILLLNASLTTNIEDDDSHKSLWASFMTKLFGKIAEINPQCIYVLWGKKSSQLDKVISSKNILTSNGPHPKEMYSGFLKCDHFNIINQLLKDQGKEIINWNIN
jgi:uracil-DNA glycosylase